MQAGTEQVASPSACHSPLVPSSCKARAQRSSPLNGATRSRQGRGAVHPGIRKKTQTKISVKDAQALVERPTLGSAIDPVAPHSGSSPPVLTSKNLYLKFFFFLQWGEVMETPPAAAAASLAEGPDGSLHQLMQRDDLRYVFSLTVKWRCSSAAESPWRRRAKSSCGAEGPCVQNVAGRRRVHGLLPSTE